MTKCANYGAVSGSDRYTGGVAGYTTARNKTTVLACRNEAAVASTNTEPRASTGSIVGNAQNLIWGGCTAAESALPMLGRSGKVAEKTTSDVCPAFEAKSAPQDAALPETFTVTFLANGETIGEVTCKQGDTSVKAPALPQLSGYTAAWPKFTLTGRDMTVTAIYRQNLVPGGKITASGTYFIPWLASGEITVAAGLDVTLVGLDSGSGSFDNLTLTVGDNTHLTLQDVRIAGDKTLLRLGRGCTLTLRGENALLSSSDEPNNACPTMTAAGDLTIAGSGSLQLQAQVNNAAFMAAEQSNISIEDCTIAVSKTDKLGFDGGAFCANGSAVTITGAVFTGRTDSDNVAVLSADTISITNSTVRVVSEKCTKAVLGSVSLRNVRLYAYGHSGNSAKTVSEASGTDALGSISAQSGVTALARAAFSDADETSAYLQDIEACAASGLMTGTGKNVFSPDKPMTRAMLVTVLWRMAGSPAASGNGGFADLRADWYRQAAIWGAQTGVVTGTGAGTFSPDQPVTKQQALTLLARYAAANGLTASADAPSVYVAACSDWSRESVQFAYRTGLCSSYAACLADPTAAATRAELAHMLLALQTLLQKA